MEVWVMVEQIGNTPPQVTLVTADSQLAHKEFDKADARLAKININAAGVDAPMTEIFLDLSRHEVEVPAQGVLPFESTRRWWNGGTRR